MFGEIGFDLLWCQKQLLSAFEKGRSNENYEKRFKLKS